MGLLAACSTLIGAGLGVAGALYTTDRQIELAERTQLRAERDDAYDALLQASWNYYVSSGDVVEELSRYCLSRFAGDDSKCSK